MCIRISWNHTMVMMGGTRGPAEKLLVAGYGELHTENTRNHRVAGMRTEAAGASGRRRELRCAVGMRTNAESNGGASLKMVSRWYRSLILSSPEFSASGTKVKETTATANKIILAEKAKTPAGYTASTICNAENAASDGVKDPRLHIHGRSYRSNGVVARREMGLDVVRRCSDNCSLRASDADFE
ncbi:hypothetical protein JB92DRAFT_2831320 [Gautieria morchelliformis]|nr:hypothetical protein JB92DRAFT_2831320 [Gautieria morchelliformis]